MVRSVVRNFSDIQWEQYSMCPPLTSEVDEIMNLHLPKSFLKLLRRNDGGNVDYEFEYFDVFYKRKIVDCISVILGLEHKREYYGNLLEEFMRIQFNLPIQVLPFALNGGGNRICFDYREDPKTDNPPIVYWNHESPPETSVSFIAKDFDSFIKMLREPEQDEDAMSDEEFEEWYKSQGR